MPRLIAILLFLISCGSAPDLPLPQATRRSWPAPDYVKDVVAYPEGYGIYVYFTLADRAGEQTASDGTAIVTYADWRYNYYDGETYEILCRDTFPVRAEDFRLTTLGRGAFEHQGLIYPVGRSPLERFKKLRASSQTGKVSVRFIPTPGCTLYAATTVIWPD